MNRLEKKAINCPDKNSCEKVGQLSYCSENYPYCPHYSNNENIIRTSIAARAYSRTFSRRQQ